MIFHIASVFLEGQQAFVVNRFATAREEVAGILCFFRYLVDMENRGSLGSQVANGLHSCNFKAILAQN